jgi:hypothetical protein
VATVGEPVHQPTDIGNAFGGYNCACGRSWLDTFASCAAGGREGQPIKLELATDRPEQWITTEPVRNPRLPRREAGR